MPERTDFLVDRDDLHHTTVFTTETAELEPGEARLKVDAFGFSANNISYAAYGDMIGYWTFFPAPPTDDETNWGRVPVWGFADVVESRCDDLPEGDRIYGYLPMSTDLVVVPGRVSPGGFVDRTEHRAALPAAYNAYTRCAGDPGYDPHFEAEQMLLRPLFFTSFLIDDFLDDNDFFGARVVVATSASSKTAYGTAHLLGERDLVVVGLTSAGNVDFVEGMECYDEVLTYDQIESLPVEPAILIDFAGNAGLVRSIHEHYGEDLVHSAVIGGTHWDAGPGATDPLPGPTPSFFFAPTQVDKRHADWGRGELERRISEAWLPFIEKVNGWIEVEHGSGFDAVGEVYLEMLDGKTRPDVAKILHP